MSGENPDLFTAKEARRYLRMDSTAFYRLVNAGVIPGFRRGAGWWFLKSDLDAYLRAQVQSATSPDPTPIRRTA